MTGQPRFPGLILAGGRSLRLGGGDKGLLPLSDRPLLAHVIDRLASQAAPLALSANGDPVRFAGFGLAVLPDAEAAGAGPLAGVLAGLRWAARLGAPALVTAAADTPFLPADLVRRLADAAGTRVFAIAATPGSSGPDLHPTFGLWPVALADHLASALARGERRVGAWALAAGAERAAFPDAAAFFNVNTPEDLAQARAMRP